MVVLFTFHGGRLYRANAEGMVGGAEVQYHIIAKQLAKHADVHVVTMADMGDGPLDVPDGISLHPLGDHGGRLAFLRKVRMLDRILQRVRPQIVMQRGAGFLTWILWRLARRHGARFVYHWASDADADGSSMRERRLYRRFYLRARRRADRQIVQTEHQLSLISSAEADRATIVPNALDPALAIREATPGDEVLWVGSIKAYAKRPDRFFDLAARLPHRSFRMIGQVTGDDAFKRWFYEALAAAPNVTWSGFKERRELAPQFDGARMLVNVSDFEGFPNTFLEAMAAGLPVVSWTVDPNGILEKGAGRCVHASMDALVDGVEAFFDDEDEWGEARREAIAAADRHAPEVLGDAVWRAVQELAG